MKILLFQSLLPNCGNTLWAFCHWRWVSDSIHVKGWLQVTTRKVGCSDLSNGLTELLGQLYLRLLLRNQKYSIITAIAIIINFTITTYINFPEYRILSVCLNVTF